MARTPLDPDQIVFLLWDPVLKATRVDVSNDAVSFQLAVFHHLCELGYRLYRIYHFTDVAQEALCYPADASATVHTPVEFAFRLDFG